MKYIYLLSAILFFGHSVNAQDLEVEGDVIVSGDATASNLRIGGSSGAISVNTNFGPNSEKTILLGVINGESTGSPQIRFQTDLVSNFVDIGMDSTGAFLIEHNDDPKMRIMPDGAIQVFGAISNVSDPIESQDAATKAYVDNIVINYFLSLPNGIQTLLNAGASTSDFIGLNHAGGIIFFMRPDGTGLVAALDDQSAGAEWGCVDKHIPGAEATEIGRGDINTSEIDRECTVPGIAADICINLDANGFTDWFLPTKDELNEMYLTIGQGATGTNQNIGGFDNSSYWSSSGLDDSLDEFAWIQNFADGIQSIDGKTVNNRVRAIRAF